MDTNFLPADHTEFLTEGNEGNKDLHSVFGKPFAVFVSFCNPGDVGAVSKAASSRRTPKRLSCAKSAALSAR
jgi:hypothetical protein